MLQSECRVNQMHWCILNFFFLLNISTQMHKILQCYRLCALKKKKQNIHLHGTNIECITFLVQVKCSVIHFTAAKFSNMIWKEQKKKETLLNLNLEAKHENVKIEREKLDKYCACGVLKENFFMQILLEINFFVLQKILTFWCTFRIRNAFSLSVFQSDLVVTWTTWIFSLNQA